MNAATKLSTYGLVLAAALGGGALVGATTGPVDTGSPNTHDTHARTDDAARHIPPGLQVAQAGYRFIPEARVVEAGPFRFQIVGPDGTAVTDFDVEHEKRLHLIVASRDLITFHHVHPTMGPDGTWTVDLPHLPAGAYRAFADFRPTGAEALTLGIDMTMPGTVGAPVALTPETSTSVDGYEVHIEGDLVPGSATEVTVTVRRDGEPVTTDQYLGARGHLVALRDGDLAYLHVHPLDADGPGVRFGVEVPSAGTYGLFFDFVHGGEVHTARFVVEAATTAVAPEAPDHDPPDHVDSHG